MSLSSFTSLVALVTLFLPAAPAASDLHRFFHVRPLDPVLSRILHESYQHSPTVRSLVDQLEQSDVIAHVVSRTRQTTHAGTLHFVTAGHGVRFVRITIDSALPRRSRAAVLAHELQHAVEVAQATWVADEPSFARLYRTIGRASGQGQMHYETAAAERIGARVFAELGRSEWRHAY